MTRRTNGASAIINPKVQAIRNVQAYRPPETCSVTSSRLSSDPAIPRRPRPAELTSAKGEVQLASEAGAAGAGCCRRLDALSGDDAKDFLYAEVQQRLPFGLPIDLVGPADHFIEFEI